jgi:2-polyprenyl-3-methyl-5-hydroxy-6-metoxy-1,4-benzoquinol methylase
MESSEFYAEFSPWYREYALKRKAYLQSVDDFIKADANGKRSIIDIGAGDGTRLQKILATMDGPVGAVAVDDSDGMIALLQKIPDLKVLKADIASPEFHPTGKYEIVLCLWNVIGHVTTEKERMAALKHMADLLEDDGIIFLDVNNRYNVVQYGLKSVLMNIIKDIFIRNGRNGDFPLIMKAGGKEIGTVVHLFSPIEIEKLIHMAGLKMVQRWIINYETGKRVDSVWSGQLMYKLTKL